MRSFVLDADDARSLLHDDPSTGEAGRVHEGRRVPDSGGFRQLLRGVLRRSVDDTDSPIRCDDRCISTEVASRHRRKSPGVVVVRDIELRLRGHFRGAVGSVEVRERGVGRACERDDIQRDVVGPSTDSDLSAGGTLGCGTATLESALARIEQVLIETTHGIVRHAPEVVQEPDATAISDYDGQKNAGSAWRRG